MIPQLPHEDAPSDAPTSLTDWSQRHSSEWARVKDTFRRDWMQSAAGGDGPSAAPRGAAVASAEVAARARARLQSVTREGEQGLRDAGEAIGAERRALRAKLSELLEHAAQAKLATDRAVLAVTLRAAERMRRENEKVAATSAARERAEGDWRQAEREAHFGYVARLQHPSEAWGDALEATLRAEWAPLAEGRAWSEARAGVRCGWEYARNTL
jgi:hypothetical protein